MAPALRWSLRVSALRAGWWRGYLVRWSAGPIELFYYTPNLFANDQAAAKWVRYAPLLDRRAKPLIDVAVFYPDTANKLDEAGIREWSGAVLHSRVLSACHHGPRFCVSEQMILDGALDRYKVLVFLWGDTTEKPVLDRIAQWVERRRNCDHGAQAAHRRGRQFGGADAGSRVRPAKDALSSIAETPCLRTITCASCAASFRDSANSPGGKAGVADGETRDCVLECVGERRTGVVELR